LTFNGLHGVIAQKIVLSGYRLLPVELLEEEKITKFTIRSVPPSYKNA
jgi:hypothetical protein